MYKQKAGFNSKVIFFNPYKETAFYERKKKITSDFVLISTDILFHNWTFLSCLLDTAEVSLSNTLWKFILDLTSTIGPPCSTWQSKKVYLDFTPWVLSQRKGSFKVHLRLANENHTWKAQKPGWGGTTRYSQRIFKLFWVWQRRFQLTEQRAQNFKSQLKNYSSVELELNSRGTTHPSYTAEP